MGYTWYYDGRGSVYLRKGCGRVHWSDTFHAVCIVIEGINLS